MCWVAIDRGVRLARKRGFPAPLKEWIEQRDAIYEQVFRDFWDEKRQAFTQRKNHPGVDASALMMPLVRFISPTDPRWLSTLKAIEGTSDRYLAAGIYGYQLSNAAEILRDYPKWSPAGFGKSSTPLRSSTGGGPSC